MKKCIFIIMVFGITFVANAQSGITQNKISISVSVVTVEDDSLIVTGVPSGYEVEYLAKEKNSNQYYVVVRPTKDWDYFSFKVFYGMPGKEFSRARLNEAVIRYRDGGTTYIVTEIGTLYFPQRAMPKGEIPSFTASNGTVTELERISLD